MWACESVFYQIYPLGFCGAPEYGVSGTPVPRVRRIAEWLPHLCSLGVGAVYFGPVFASDKHGYDTRDFRTLDPRLGEGA
ncbi:MAG: cyclomaltodextrinase, partial [Deltaproteobacteria bacterium]|nr:cyclomaltodextrinase [Deltaproteobacteria bacterium]